MTCGIYMIKNLTNNKVYIGQAINIENRWEKEHLVSLQKNKHPNKHLQRAFNKDKECNFKHSIIETCFEDQLDEREEHWIAIYKSYLPKYGYNKTLGGKGIKHTEETRKKISESSIGEKNGFYGKKHTKETKQKISDANLGRTWSKETRKKQMEIHKRLGHNIKKKKYDKNVYRGSRFDGFSTAID